MSTRVLSAGDTSLPSSVSPVAPVAPGTHGDTAPSGSEPPQPIADAVWRYHLDVLIGETAGAASWQGTDPVLGRKVGIRLLPASDERAEDFREAACLAARVSDQRLVHVLDVVDVRFEGEPHVAVVTEWVVGRPFTDLLSEPLAPAEAFRVSAEVAECLAVAHAQGIAHGRLVPTSVLITDNGDVRVRGLGTDAVLRGCAPDPNPATSDVQGVGALLYASSTGRWPYGPTDGLAGAPEMGGSVPIPSRVAAAVPAAIDGLCARSVAGCTPPRDGLRFTTIAGLAAALRAESGPTRDTPPDAPVMDAGGSRAARRLIGTIVGLLAVAGVAIVGWQLVGAAPAAFSPRPASSSVATAVAPTPSKPASATAAAAAVERPLPIIRVSDYDPLGNGAENPELAPQAIDGKVGTAWSTVTYRDDYLSGKDGVGLLLDLGAPRPIKAVKLSLLGAGTDLTILTSDQPSDNPSTFTPFGTAVGAPGDTTVRSPKPITARYVLVWLTRVPKVDQGYQGGISEVSVLG